ncbi:MAG: helix-turn-helix domain-containing protein [Alphaproteobacteria bacterium]|nr:helix-turn-helix domain-containing protein [Alphaproteobacteria bacterium]
MPRRRAVARPRRPARPLAANVIEIKPQSVPAVAKAIAVIRLLNGRSSAGAALSDISDTLRITRSHCYNILRTLADHAWIVYDPPTRLYRLGPALAADSTAALLSHPHLPIVRPAIDRLADEIGLPCTVCEPIADGSFLVVHTAHYPDPTVSAAPVGYRFPPTAAAQFKARLAWLAPAAREAALSIWQPVQHTKTTIMDRPTLERDLDAARARGCVRSSGEFVEGFVTLALPIFDRAGDVVLIASCAARTGALDGREAEVAAALARAVNAVHATIDGRPPIDFPRP